MKTKFNKNGLPKATFNVIKQPIPKYTMSDAVKAPLKEGEVVEIDGVIYDVVKRVMR